MVYTHVLNRGGLGVKSPLDRWKWRAYRCDVSAVIRGRSLVFPVDFAAAAAFTCECSQLYTPSLPMPERIPCNRARFAATPSQAYAALQVNV